MTVKTGSAWAGTFVTLDATGALATPSTGPAGTLYVDGVANGATVTITGSNPYKWAVTLPSLTAGQRVDMYITATIATIATAGFVASAQADTALLSEVKTDTAAILADTGTDGVKVASLATDSITADALKADAITEIQAGLALEATLTAIKGAGWTNETLAAIDALIDAIKAKSDLIPAQPAAIGSAMTLTAAYEHAKDDVLTPLGVVDGVVDAIKLKTDNIPATPANEATLTAIKGTGWSDETLVALMNAIEAISVGSGATPQQIWEYVTRTLTNPDDYKADVSGLATTLHLQDVEDKVDVVDAVADAIKVKTDNLPTSPAPAGEYDAELAAIQADLDNPNQYKADVSALAKTTHVQEVEDKVDAVKLKTDNIPTNPAIAGEYTASLEAIQADLDNTEQYKADISALATTAHMQEVEDKVDIVETTVDLLNTTGVTLTDASVDAILDEVVVGTYTMRQLLKVMAAALAGKATGGGTTEVKFSGVDDASNVIVATVDANGNRSAVTLTV